MYCLLTSKKENKKIPNLNDFLRTTCYLNFHIMQQKTFPQFYTEITKIAKLYLRKIVTRYCDCKCFRRKEKYKQFVAPFQLNYVEGRNHKDKIEICENAPLQELGRLSSISTQSSRFFHSTKSPHQIKTEVLYGTKKY